MEVKPGYKQTEVGVIPEEWGTTTLESACVPGGVVRGPFGGALKKEIFVSSGKKVYEQRNAIYRDDSIGNYYIDEVKYRELQRFAVSPGEFIVSCAGTIGRIFRIPASAQPGVINQALLKLHTDGEVVDSDFFYHYFDWDQFQRRIIDNTHGGAMQNLVGMDSFRCVEFPRPPLPEQRAIAKALSDVDGLLGGLDRLIAKKRDLKQATMQQLLTGQTRLPGFHGEWEVKSIGDLANISKGTQLHSSETNPDGHFPHFNGGISPSSFADKFNTPANTIAISEGGNSCGYVQLVPQPFWCGGHCYAVVPKNADNRFLFHALKGQQTAIQGLRVGSGLPNVQKTALADFELRLPSDEPEQTAIAEVLTEMDLELAALEQRREKTRALKQAMMQELLTGKTRLVSTGQAHA